LGGRVRVLGADASLRSTAHLFVPPRKSQFRPVLEALYGLQPERVESDYAACFLEAAVRLRKRALVVLLT